MIATFMINISMPTPNRPQMLLWRGDSYIQLRLSWSAEKPCGRQCDGNPLGAGILLRDLGFGDLGLKLHKPECSLRLKFNYSTAAPRKEGVLMSHFQRTDDRKDAPDWGFLAFVITITAIAVAAALIQIYLQNPK
jgi:hypothetical protein